MSYNQHWVASAWSALCDRCGFKYKSFQLRKEWTGLMVCKDCWEPRHPQDLIKIPKEDVSVPWSRPEQADVFITVTYSTAGNQENTIPPGMFDLSYILLEDGSSFLLLEDSSSKILES